MMIANVGASLGAALCCLVGTFVGHLAVRVYKSLRGDAAKSKVR